MSAPDDKTLTPIRRLKLDSRPPSGAAPHWRDNPMCGRPARMAVRRIGSLAAIVTLLSFGAGTARSGEHHFVLRDGTKVPIEFSETEIGVVVSRGADVKAAAARLKTACGGDLVDVTAAPDSFIKLLRVTKATPERRAIASQDPSVRRAGRVYRFRGSPAPVITFGRIALKVRPDLSDAQREAVWDQYGLRNVEAFDELMPGVYTGDLPPGSDDMLLAERVADDPRTQWAHPDTYQVYRPMQVIPSDPFFDQQWHLNNNGLLFEGVEDADIDALEAWSIADGDGVLFGMFDHGCDVDHEDLIDRYIGVGQDVTVASGEPGSDDPRPKLPFSFEFHGTNVMGLAVASGNALGVRGVSFRSQFTASRGLELVVSSAQIARAYPFAVSQGVDVHINSWGPIFASPVAPIVEDAIQTAFETGRDPDGAGGDDPLGMVIVFASGNGDFFTGLGEEIAPGFGPSTLDSVISVGATSVRDEKATFSNFGPTLNVMAPGAAFIATTDNEDRPGLSAGLNNGGFVSDPDFGFVFFDIFGNPIPDLDAGGKYTGFFNGTSAACPIAAGVAGLILSVNDQLSATEVRIILEHTCDQIEPEVANYNGITSRSLTHGYGRVNAHQAVLAAQNALGAAGTLWPDVPSNVEVFGSTLTWVTSENTSDFLVVTAQRDFKFVPEDGMCYDAAQTGCAGQPIEPVPADVSVSLAGCTPGTECAAGTQQSLAFQPPEFGRRFFAIYARNAVGQYSFGVAIDSTAATSGGEVGDDPIRPPAVAISATPLQGVSPLRVTFNGNAVGDLEIDGNRTEWNFDVVENDNTLVDATTPLAAFTYIVEPGETKKFTARLKMHDVVGNEGSASVQIRVSGPVEESATGEAVVPEISIGVVGAGVTDPLCQTSVCGRSPFGVLYRVNTSESNVALSVQSVIWDLGDGATSSSQSVSHTYVNESDVPQVIPVTATISFRTATGASVPRSITRLITVLSGTAVVDPENPNLPGTEVFGEGGAAIPCGLAGVMPLVGCLGGLFLLRRRGR